MKAAGSSCSRSCRRGSASRRRSSSVAAALIFAARALIQLDRSSLTGGGRRPTGPRAARPPPDLGAAREERLGLRERTGRGRLAGHLDDCVRAEPPARGPLPVLHPRRQELPPQPRRGHQRRAGQRKPDFLRPPAAAKSAFVLDGLRVLLARGHKVRIIRARASTASSTVSSCACGALSCTLLSEKFGLQLTLMYVPTIIILEYRRPTLHARNS